MSRLEIENITQVINLVEMDPNVDDLCQGIVDMFPLPIVPDGWRVSKFLGNGSFGVALGTQGPNGQSGAVKLIKEGNLEIVEREVRMGNKFHKIGLSPNSKKISSFEIEDGFYDNSWYHAIHMDRLDGILSGVLNDPSLRTDVMDRIVQKSFDVIERLKKARLCHGDFHFGNIGFLYPRMNGDVGKIQIIDHGLSTELRACPELEVVQLLRGTMNFPEPVRDYMNRRIRKEAEDRLGITYLPEGRQLGFLLKDLRDEMGIILPF